MKFLLTHERIGLEISNHYSSCSFHPMSTKLYEDIGDHGGIQSITSLGQKKKKSAKKMLHFEILTWESMGKPKMCILSRKQLIVQRNGHKFGTRCTTVHICRVLLMPNSFSLVWGQSVYFANFQFYNFLHVHDV